MTYTVSIAFKEKRENMIVHVMRDNGELPRLGDAYNTAENCFFMFNEVQPIESIAVRKDSVTIDYFDGQDWENERVEIMAANDYKEHIEGV